METIKTTIYKCSHCPKYYRHEHFAIKHEAKCMKNPVNYRACIGCVHLSKRDVTVYEDMWDGEHERTVNILHCSKIESFLYPPKVEANKSWFETDPETNQPMPKECEHKEGWEMGVQNDPDALDFAFKL